MECKNCAYPQQVRDYLTERKYLEKESQDTRLWLRAVSKINKLQLPSLPQGCSECSRLDKRTKDGLKEVIEDKPIPLIITYLNQEKLRVYKRKEDKMRIETKGLRDFLPEEKILRDKIVEIIKKVFEKYGYSPIETPAIENLSVLTSKEGISEKSETYQEIFKFKDRAGRKLGLKFDQTVPLARVVNENPQLPKPFRRYQIDRAWRDGPTRPGRYKEFWQCDCDIVGSDSMKADAEIIATASEIFNKLGLKVNILVNNRKLLNGILKSLKIQEKNFIPIIMLIDKLDKLPEKEIIKEAKEKGFKEVLIRKIFSIIKNKRFKEIPECQEALDELKELFNYLKIYRIKVVFQPSLARGLDYYTGTVFEVKSKGFKSSLLGGGRYDKMIRQAGKYLPAVGYGIGLDTVYDLLSKEQKMEKTVSKVLVISIGKDKEAIELAQKLRKENTNTELWLEKGISKALEYANSKKIPYVIFLGKEEAKKGKIKLRDMKTGKERFMPF